jgi:hypothetical protein
MCRGLRATLRGERAREALRKRTGTFRGSPHSPTRAALAGSSYGSPRSPYNASPHGTPRSASPGGGSPRAERSPGQRRGDSPAASPRNAPSPLGSSIRRVRDVSRVPSPLRATRKQPRRAAAATAADSAKSPVASPAAPDAVEDKWFYIDFHRVRPPSPSRSLSFRSRSLACVARALCLSLPRSSAFHSRLTPAPSPGDPPQPLSDRRGVYRRFKAPSSVRKCRSGSMQARSRRSSLCGAEEAAPSARSHASFRGAA